MTQEISLRVEQSPSPVKLTVPTRSPVTLQTEQVRIIREYYKCVYVDSTQNWNAQVSYIPKKGDIIIYNDRDIIYDEHGNMLYVPGVKIGDGNAYLIDMPFIDAAQIQRLENHINDSIRHITASERTFWNNKLNLTINGEELSFDRN